jgi:CDI immunity proteins
MSAHLKLTDLDPSLTTLPDYGSGVSQRAIAIVSRRLSDLSSGDVAFCLRQSIAVEHIAPVALSLVVTSPLLEAELYPGDLLLSLLYVARKNLLSPQQVSELREVCSYAQVSVEAIATEVVPSLKAFCAWKDGA